MSPRPWPISRAQMGGPSRARPYSSTRGRTPDGPSPATVPVGRRPHRLAAMDVHLTRIYTRTGDDGTTVLGDYSRVRKTDVRLAAYADTDECNAAVGVAVTVGALSARVLGPLRQVQNDLFDVGAD